MWFLLIICLSYSNLSIASNIILSEKVPLYSEIESDIVPNEIQGRIVGGRNATCEEFPHQVSFIVNNSYFCGGFIVSDRYILTAAHCAQDVDPSTVVLRAGSTYRTNGTVIPIVEVIPYPDYDNPPFDKDVAVMKTAEPLEFNECIQPLALAPKGMSVDSGVDMTVSGWGRTRQGASTIPERLMAVNLPIVNQNLCQASYAPLSITENMVCAGNFFFGGKSTCQGDSGGTATVNGKDGEKVAYGIVSFGRGCGSPFSPSVFTRIPANDMRDFIANHTGL